MALPGRTGPIPVKLLFIKECIIQKGKSRALCRAEEWSVKHFTLPSSWEQGMNYLWDLSLLFPHPTVLTRGNGEMELELWLLSPNTAVTAGKIIDQDIFITGNQLQLSPCPRCCWVYLGARSQTSIPLLEPGWDPAVRNSVPFPASDGPASLQYFGERCQAFGRLSIHLLPPGLKSFGVSLKPLLETNPSTNQALLKAEGKGKGTIPSRKGQVTQR